LGVIVFAGSAAGAADTGFTGDGVAPAGFLISSGVWTRGSSFTGDAAAAAVVCGALLTGAGASPLAARTW